METPVFAKIAGYLKEIRVDRGDRVRKGQVLAILESPELDEQVADAKHYLWLQTTTDVRDQGLVLNTESLNKSPTTRTPPRCRQTTPTNNC